MPAHVRACLHIGSSVGGGGDHTWPVRAGAGGARGARLPRHGRRGWARVHGCALVVGTGYVAGGMVLALIRVW